MTKSQIAELVKVCDCREIQDKWIVHPGDEYYVSHNHKVYSIVAEKHYPFLDAMVWLPREGDCIKGMGKDFDELKLGEDKKYYCLYCMNRYEINKSARIACIQAWKATLKGE